MANAEVRTAAAMRSQLSSSTLPDECKHLIRIYLEDGEAETQLPSDVWTREFLVLMAYLVEQYPHQLSALKVCDRACKMAQKWVERYAQDANSLKAMRSLEKIESNLTAWWTVKRMGVTAIAVLMIFLLVWYSFPHLI